MKTSGNTMLITGGGSGIGLALAQAFLAKGNTVIICGRSEEKLQAVVEANPGLHYRIADVSKPEARRALTEELSRNFPALNVLVNNAGVQEPLDLTAPLDEEVLRAEIATNLEAPIHLASLLLSTLRCNAGAAIINVTSGLAFVPRARVPVYCATKAALHSYTISLRRQLAGTGVEVVEVAPPLVATGLQKGAARESIKASGAIGTDQVVREVLAGLERGAIEINVGRVKILRRLQRLLPRKAEEIMNR